jgi:ATP-dependent Zn protease
MDQSVGLSYVDSGAVNGAMNPAIRDKVNTLLEQELGRAIRIIKANQTAIDTMVEALLQKNHLKENEIDEIFKKTVNRTEKY